jgi:hypothetical protein
VEKAANDMVTDVMFKGAMLVYVYAGWLKSKLETMGVKRVVVV